MSVIDRSRPPAPGRVRRFSFPQPQVGHLDNGLAVYAARHGNVPVVTAHFVADAGGSAESDGSEGLAQLVVHTMDAGTSRRSLDEVAWALESLGVTLDVDSGWDSAVVRVTAARDRLEKAVEVMAEVVREPSFPEDQVHRLRDQHHAALLQRRKEPRALANDVLGGFLYRADSRFARPLAGTPEIAAAFTRDQVADFYRRRFAPGSAALALTGDIDPDEAGRLADRYFGDWPARSAPPTRIPTEPASDTATIYVVHRPGAVQSELRVGHVGIERAHPDYFAVVVMNTLLGGAFTSRLNMNLRERHGFTYGASSRFDARRAPGPFVISTAVATDVTASAIQEIIREVHALRDEGASPEEVAGTRDYLIGVMPLRVQTTGQLAARLGELFVHDLPTSYFREYIDRIAAVTPEHVAAVARHHLRPDRFALVVVGDADAVADPLRALDVGPVEVRSVS